MRAAGIFAVIQMQCLQPVKADHAVKFRQHAVQIVSDVIACIRYMTGVETHAEKLSAAAGVKNRAQFFKPAADLASLAGHRFEQNGRVLLRADDCVQTCGDQVDSRFDALPDVAAGMEIVEIAGRQFHAQQVICKNLAGKLARPLILGAGVQRIRRMRHERAQPPVPLHLYERGGVRRVGAFCCAAARIAREELKSVRADRQRGFSHCSVALRRGQMAAQIQHKRPPGISFLYFITIPENPQFHLLPARKICTITMPHIPH